MKKFIWKVEAIEDPSWHGEQFCYLNNVQMPNPISISRVTRSGALGCYEETAVKTRAELELLIAKAKVHREKCIDILDKHISILKNAIPEEVEDDS